VSWFDWLLIALTLVAIFVISMAVTSLWYR
jgi:hypothetical protein